MSDDESNAKEAKNPTAGKFNVEKSRASEKPRTLNAQLKLRAPREHGQSLNLPPLHGFQRLRNELQKKPSSNSSTGLARAELVKAAYEYTRTYTDVENVSLNDATASNLPVVMSGHQPSLFHCGVWYKNFVLSSVASELNATAINLVVDNDLFAGNSIICPAIVDADGQRIKRASLTQVQIDEPSAAVPFESRAVTSEKQFFSFANRLSQAILPIVQNPIVNQLWPEITKVYRQGEQRFGHAVAAGRHRFEQSLGLNTLELPISLMAQTHSFAKFVAEIVDRRSELRTIYNESLYEYRKANSIRSSSHPVPELESYNEWIEVPFWVWTKGSPNRKQLFVAGNKNNLTLTDRENFSQNMNLSNLASWILENANRVSIRPKALTNTLFCRAYCGNLFVHGIGGAKYDQLTDVIASKFYLAEPPPYLTATATMHLPAEFDRVSLADKTAASVLLRNLRFHPEKSVSRSDQGSAASLIQHKQSLVNAAHLENNRKQRHEEIELVNEQLQVFVEQERGKLLARKRFVEKHLRTSQILGSREFSFSLFPESIIESLFELAQTTN